MWEKIQSFFEVTTNIAIKVLALYGIWSIIRRIFVRPRLSVYLENDKTYHKVLDVDVNKMGNFVHVTVRNKRWLEAKSCQGSLIDVEQMDSNGTFSSHLGFRGPVVLKWTGEGDFGPRNIGHKLSRGLDVCYVHEGKSTLHAFTQKFPRGIQTDFPIGMYRFTIRVSGENVRAITKSYIIRWEGNWENLTIESGQ